MPGRPATPGEIAELRKHLPSVDDQFVEYLHYPIIGVNFELSDDDDRSGMGVDLRVLTPSEMIDEALNHFPGISAIALGYFPFGACLEGSGDPYFVEKETLTFVRIPHGAIAADQSLNLRAIELVQPTLEDFLATSDPVP